MSGSNPLIGPAPDTYDSQWYNLLFRNLNAYFTRANQPQPVRATTLNINIDTLPTEAALATLRSGDVYRDTTAANVLKIKP